MKMNKNTIYMVQNPIEEGPKKVLVIRNKNRTMATVFAKNKKCIGVARRNPEDTDNEQFAVELATTRAMVTCSKEKEQSFKKKAVSHRNQAVYMDKLAAAQNIKTVALQAKLANLLAQSKN